MLSTRDRLAAWLVTGPLGRFLAFLIDFGTGFARWGAAELSGRLRSRGSSGR